MSSTYAKNMNCMCWGTVRKKDKSHKKDVFERLPRSQRAIHGVGHVLNDLVSGVWFSYIIIYLTKVVGLSNRLTGLIILLGQITDGVFTPFIGIICDRTVCRYGRRKVWHLIGTVLVSATLPLLLIRLLEESTSDVLKMVYYVGIASVFQFGWGCVQISHLSLIPEISRREDERVELNAIRSAMTFLCGIYVYGVTWVLLGQSSEYKITPKVWHEFMYLSFIVVGTGNLFNIIFHVGMKEPLSIGYLKRQELKLSEKKDPAVTKSASVLPAPDQTSSRKDWVAQSFENTALETKQEPEDCCKNISHGVTSDDVTDKKENYMIVMNGSPQCCRRIDCHDVTTSQEHGVALDLKMSDDCVTKPKPGRPKCRSDWLKCPAFYKAAIVYMCARLVVNISQAYLPLYLTETLNFEKEAIAYFPLVVLISGVLSSMVVKTLDRNLGSKITYILGATTSLCACAWFYLQTVDMRNGVYAATVLIGSGGSVMLVTSLSLIANLIGDDKTYGAFIYGAISFCDKLSSGVVIVIIQELTPREHQVNDCSKCNEYVRQVQSIAPGVAALVGLLTVVLFYKSTFVCRKRVQSCEAAVQVTMDQSWTERQQDFSSPDPTLPVPRRPDCVAQIHRYHDRLGQLEFETRF